MAQLVVRNLPDEVKERLKRRARRHGVSLEAEVRQILLQVPEPEPRDKPGSDWTSELLEKLRKTGVTKEDVASLDESIAELRRDWRTRDLEK